MRTLTIANFPDSLYSRLARRAESLGRDLDAEVIAILALFVDEGIPDPLLDPEGFLAYNEKNIREMPGPPLTIEEIEEAINEGRE